MRAPAAPVTLGRLPGSRRMVCRASKEKIDYDTIVAAPFAEFNAIRDKARSFLLRTEM